MSPSADVHDTQDKYKQDNVSYGTEFTALLADGTEIKFSNNRLETATKIDGRNLKHSLYLSLGYSVLTSLETVHFTGLLVLILDGCRIGTLNAVPLTSVIHLSIRYTDITEIQTESLG